MGTPYQWCTVLSLTVLSFIRFDIWHNAGVPSPFLNKRCRLLYVQWQYFGELIWKTDYFPDLCCFINWILYQLFCDSTWSLRFFTSPPALLLLSHWPNCTGCLWRPEVWVFKESREEALVWRTSWLWNIPLRWGLLVGLLCHWWTHFIMSCICAYTYIGFRFVENRNVYLQIWNPYIHQTLVFHLLE